MELWNQVFTTVLLPLLTALVSLAAAYLYKKVQELVLSIKSKKIQSTVSAAVDAVYQAVQSTTQTYVDSLKASGTFTAEAQTEAFNKSKTVALTMITTSSQQIISSAFGDFDTWINTKIEELVRECKTK